MHHPVGAFTIYTKKMTRVNLSISCSNRLSEVRSVRTPMKANDERSEKHTGSKKLKTERRVSLLDKIFISAGHLCSNLYLQEVIAPVPACCGILG